MVGGVELTDGEQRVLPRYQRLTDAVDRHQVTGHQRFRAGVLDQEGRGAARTGALDEDAIVAIEHSIIPTRSGLEIGRPVLKRGRVEPVRPAA